MRTVRGMRVERANRWGSAVFHVLAHVEVDGPASCFSPAYRAWVAERVAAVGERTLAEDARLLAELARRDERAFAQAQALAWVFSSAESVRAAAERELRDAAVDDEEARAIAIAAGPLAEVLRAAAELEMPLLPVVDRVDRRTITLVMSEVTAAAPRLGDCTIELTPALGLRGRVYNSHIFVGLPGVAGATPEHVAWQAAHEATVDEVAASALGEALPFLDLERRALGLLRSRARRAGLGEAHARWLAHLDLSAIGAIPDVEDPA